MTYNTMSLHHPQFFDNTNSDDQFNEDLNMDWNMNIDPSLDSFSFQHPHSQPPISFQVQQQVQQQRAPEQQRHQQMQHPTMQRFVNEQQRQFFTAPNIPQDILNLQHASIPTSSLPRASHHRMASPSLSHDRTSVSGSVPSPPAEQDFYPENGYYPNGMDNQLYRQSFPGLQGGSASYQAYALPPQQGFSCVSMDQVQGFVDADDGYFEHEEDFGEVAMKSEYAVDVDHHHSQTSMKTSSSSQGYRYPSDEGIGASIQDEASPKNTIHVDDSHVSDIDAEADMSDLDAEPEHIPSTPASDTEYTPKSSRTRKRRPASPNTKTPPSQKRSRISKTPQKTKGQVTCKSCSHAPFKDTALLQRHIASAHTRAYVCVFDFAGCSSTFASKNEWKRHVSSQHLNLTAWVCELGNCGGHHSKAGHSIPNTKSSHSNGAAAITRGSEFNRKDLFTQHLRRMHVPLPVKRKKAGTDAVWEDTIKSLQQTCLKIKRQAPTRLACPVCGTIFEGTGCWDDRMEHVGKHLEVQAAGKCVVRQGDDGLLLQWALREGIVERRGSGGYRLVLGGVGGGGAGRKVRNEVPMEDEEDAECEDE